MYLLITKKLAVDRVFVATGAEKGSECVKVDLSAEEEDIERLEQFAEELAAKVG